MNVKKNNLILKLVFLFSINLILSNCSSDSEIVEEIVEEENQEQENETEGPQIISSFLNISNFNLPAQDGNGFTILTTQDDSRIIYVDSNNGDDSTGEVYNLGDIEIGGDPFTPNISTIKPFATITEARENMRDYQADIMLLAADGVWNESLNATHGKSENARSIYASYGQGNRPELRTGNNNGITNRRISNIIIKGIKFWAHLRDDEGTYFESFNQNNAGFSFNNVGDNDDDVFNVLIEDCFFRSYAGNTITNKLEQGNTKPMSKVVLRRNIISRNYSSSVHSQGLFYIGPTSNGDPTSILLEGNIFDHNGWRTQQIGTGNDSEDGQATVFNHNTYFANAKGVLFYGNTFLRPSSIGNKWTANYGANSSSDISLIDNLYVDGETGISIGGNEVGPLRFKNILISNNVFSNIGRSRPTNRSLAWGIEVKDWDQGEIKNNLFLNQKNTTEIANVYAIHLNAETEMRDVTVIENKVYGFNGTGSEKELFKITGADNAASNMHILENYLYDIGVFALVEYDNQLGYTFSENNYASENSINNWFETNNAATSFTDWKNTYESNAETFDLSLWPDKTRDVDTYLNSIGKGNSIDDLIDLLYSQSETNWDPSLTAPIINQWIREGFEGSN